MKKTFATTLLTAIASLAFGNEPAQAVAFSAKDFSLEKQINALDHALTKSFVYLRMSAIDTYPANAVQVVPGLGLGYRMSTGNGALDFSANYTRGEEIHGEETSYFYTLPKASYLHYVSPGKKTSLYAGAGLAFGQLKNKEGTKFTGVVPSVTFGLETNRSVVRSFRSFVQLDVSQPAIAAELQKAVGAKFPGPIAELSVGIGY